MNIQSKRNFWTASSNKRHIRVSYYE